MNTGTTTRGSRPSSGGPTELETYEEIARLERQFRAGLTSALQ
jgi:hypothetical protein